MSFRLNTLFIGRNFLHLPEVTSTNEFAREWMLSPLPEGAVILADFQTKGKGQMGQMWHSEAGKNLLLSVILHPEFIPVPEIFLLNKLFSVAVISCLKKFLPGQKIQIKWPNDILVNKKKICGILIETQVESEKIQGIIAGVGLNVNQESFPSGFSLSPCSMKTESGKEFDRMVVLETLLGTVEGLYIRMRSGNPDIVNFEYLSNLFGYQEILPFRLLSSGEEFEANLTGVDRQGRLALAIGRKLQFFQPKEIQFLI
jgi:BirA family biotin operon repressor/biotin-[acetyl-CoA-carboxylase] ligase